MTALKDLEKRLEEATGPDRELDLMIFDALGFDAPWPKAGVDGGTFRHWIDFAAHEKRERLYFVQGWRSSSDIPIYTASLDAAVSLCERLDLKQWHVDTMNFMGYAEVRGRGAVFGSSVDVMPTPAIAICLATVRALIAKGGAGE